MRNYINSKLNIFKNQNKSCFSIICIDDSNCRKIAQTFRKHFSSKLIKISTKQKIRDGVYLEYQKEGVIIVNQLSNEKIFFDYISNWKTNIATGNYFFFLRNKLDWINLVVVDFPFVPVTPIFKFFKLKISISSRSDIIFTLLFLPSQ